MEEFSVNKILSYYMSSEYLFIYCNFTLQTIKYCWSRIPLCFTTAILADICIDTAANAMTQVWKRNRTEKTILSLNVKDIFCTS